MQHNHKDFGPLDVALYAALAYIGANVALMLLRSYVRQEIRAALEVH